jgi:hypothetical protein
MFVACAQNTGRKCCKKFASAKDGKKYYLLWGRSCIHELVHWIMILFYGHNYK